MGHHYYSASQRFIFFKYFSMAWLVFAFATAVLAVETTNSATINNSPNCTPSNCVAKCNPSCSLDQVCVLGTMSECGVCPRSSCVSRSLLGGGGGSSGGDGSSSSSGSDSSSNGNGSGGNNSSSHGNDNDQGTLIGGVVGGLLGAGLVVSAAGYAGFRYRQKKRNTLPFAFHGKSIPHNNLQTDNSSIRDMQQIAATSSSPPPLRQEVMSGVIPVAYVPPSRDSVRTQDQQPRPISQDMRSIEQQQQQYDHTVRSSTLYRFKQQQQQIHQQLPQRLSTSNDNPFSDTNHMADDDDDDEDRESVVQPTTATYQVMRARPQIMRVNTVRVQDGLTRQGSTRTILTKEDELDDPFHDRHHTTTSENNPTDSILSGPGDGEITIFWDGKRSSS